MSVEEILSSFGEGEHIHAVVTKEVPEAGQQEWIATAAKFASETRREKGCIRFAYLRVKGSTTRFMLCEEWENRQALERHFETEHFALAVPVTPSRF